jgi:hypothetical protein
VAEKKKKNSFCLSINVTQTETLTLTLTISSLSTFCDQRSKGHQCNQSQSIDWASISLKQKPLPDL